LFYLFTFKEVIVLKTRFNNNQEGCHMEPDDDELTTGLQQPKADK